MAATRQCSKKLIPKTAKNCNSTIVINHSENELYIVALNKLNSELFGRT